MPVQGQLRIFYVLSEHLFIGQTEGRSAVLWHFVHSFPIDEAEPFRVRFEINIGGNDGPESVGAPLALRDIVNRFASLVRTHAMLPAVQLGLDGPVAVQGPIVGCLACFQHRGIPHIEVFHLECGTGGNGFRAGRPEPAADGVFKKSVDRIVRAPRFSAGQDQVFAGGSNHDSFLAQSVGSEFFVPGFCRFRADEDVRDPGFRAVLNVEIRSRHPL